MDDLEVRLKTLTVPEPSDRLERRIFGGKPPRRLWRKLRDVRVPLPWAAVLAVATGLAGFSTAQFRPKADRSVSPTGTAVVQVKVVEASAAHHVFDFTETSQDFLPGNLSVRVETNNGV